MTARQKFWLKVVLAVTFPLWVIPVIALAAVIWGAAGIGMIVWELVSSIVDPPSRHGNGKRSP